MIQVLDAPVVLKWFVQEAGTEEALAVKDRLLNGKAVLAAPDLMLYETANVLRRKKEFTESAIQEALHSILDVGVEIFTPTEDMLADAVHFTFQTGQSFYDCLYLALARQLGAQFLTADEVLHRKARNFLPAVLLPK